jgi:transglutaminase-like putative cysteine protease
MIARATSRRAAVDPELTPYLATTAFCDLDHPDIQALAEELAADDGSPRAIAVRMFEWVRDEIPYFLGPWGVTASQTLLARAGTCTTKSNLLVALLRAIRIPAAYGILRVDAQRYWGVIGPAFLTRHASPSSTHVHAAVRLDGRWVRCDPSTDRRIAEKSQHYCEQNRLIEWDGATDRTDVFRPEHVHASLSLYTSVDEVLAKPMRRVTPELLELANRYIRFIREQPPFPDADSLLAAYRQTVDYDQTVAYLHRYTTERGIDPDAPVA